MNKSLRTLSLSFIFILCACSLNKKISDIKQDYTGHFSDIQYTYLTNSDLSDTSPYNGNMSLSEPAPVSLSWKASGIKKFKIKISESQNMDTPAFVYETNKKQFDFYNGKLYQYYWWTVSDVKETVVSTPMCFKVISGVAGPRNLKIEGVENVRDIGGWGIKDDTAGTYTRRMKQGMLYRSGRFNEDKADAVNVTVTNEGLKELKDNLGIKTEIDLRRTSNNEIGSLTSSALGEGVNYYNLPMLYEGKNILTWQGKSGKDTYEYDNPAMIKRFFEILADKNNYPVVFHCSIGKDRTGCLAYLVEGLLNFDQNLMYRDYMFTNFADAGMCKLSDVTDRYGRTIDEYVVPDNDNPNMQQRVYAYLKNVVGVASTDLDSVISILHENRADDIYA